MFCLLLNTLTIEWGNTHPTHLPMLLFKNIYQRCLCPIAQFVTGAESAGRKVSLMDKAPGFLSLPFQCSRCFKKLEGSSADEKCIEGTWGGGGGICRKFCRNCLHEPHPLEWLTLASVFNHSLSVEPSVSRPICQGLCCR